MDAGESAVQSVNETYLSRIAEVATIVIQEFGSGVRTSIIPCHRAAADRVLFSCRKYISYPVYADDTRLIESTVTLSVSGS